MTWYRRLWSRWAWLIILCPLAAAVAAGGGSKLLPEIYEARVDVLVRPAQPLGAYDPSQTSLSSDQISRTYAQLLTEPPLIQQVITDLNLQTTPEALAPEINVVLLPNTTILRLTVRDNVPQQAQSIANTLVAEMIAQAKRVQQEQVKQYTDQIRAQITALETNIAAEEAEIKQLTAGGRSLSADQQARLANLQQQLSSDRAHDSELVRNVASIDTENARTTDSLRVVAAASLPTTPVSPRILLNIAIAFAAGLLLAVALAALLERLDQSIKTDDDLTQETGLVALGHIVKSPTQKKGNPELPALMPQSAFAEAYKTLRTNLVFATFEKKAQIIVITSALPSEGKSRTAANLAVVLGQAGHRTLLVEADFRRPRQAAMFGSSNSSGLSNLILGDRESREVIAPVPGVTNLWLIVSGSQPPNPTELLGSVRMRDILEQFRGFFTYILVDTAPVGTVTDAALVAASADAAVLVVEHGRTSHDAVNHAKEALERSGVKILGVVFNKCRREATPYSYPYPYQAAKKLSVVGGSQPKSPPPAPATPIEVADAGMRSAQ
jgi:non-specific protein-tyrosine kinase